MDDALCDTQHVSSHMGLDPERTGEESILGKYVPVRVCI